MNKIFPLFLILFLWSCSGSDKPGLKFTDKGNEVPAFSSDSAYQFIEKQLSYGNRVPGSEGHKATAAYLRKKLRAYAGDNAVFSQNFADTVYGNTLELSNIIAAFNTSAMDRILLCAHWDTRPRADMDSVRTTEPIPGADDGGSGVAVLLELARTFSENPPPIGVDIVLFDGEDYGTSGDTEHYFLGSRYWSLNPPVPGYQPRFGILLDMVGAKEAVFPKEQYSMIYAPNLVNEVWNIADEKGYGDYFLDEEGSSVLDDHYIINQEARIPMIDIINHTRGKEGRINFAPHWHTHADDLDIISRETLKAVGEVMLELIYNRI